MSERSPSELLLTPVQYLKGVGPQRAELVEKLGLRTAADLLFFFPRAYEDMTERREVDELQEGATQSVSGTVEEVDHRGTASGGCVTGVLFRSKRGYLRGMWFNQPFMRDRFRAGDRVIVVGKPKLNGLVWEMAHPQVQVLGEEEEEPPGRIQPVYPTTEGLLQWQLRRIIESVLQTHADLLEEALPERLLATRDLPPIRTTVRQIHFPSSMAEQARARRRLVYQELFVLQLALAVKRQQQRSGAGAPILEPSAKIHARIGRLFPFELTPGQRQAIEEIAADMARPVPMNRLLQGDVGSGKTVVAAYAMLLAVAHGHQAVLMAPTEILARQHAETLDRFLAASRVRRAALTGGMAASERKGLLDRIAAGEVDLLVGTQAILQEDVRFARLGLVVIDEQHRFGVRQRAALRRAGQNPHYLVMTATPIPRTVTMTLFGDLDVSFLRDTPPGRQKVHTYLADETKRAKWWDFFARKLREGRQGYVVVPLVEESSTVVAKSLEEAYEQLANDELADFRLGLIHGRMTPGEKDAAMESFRRGEIQVLVCTSVVEVGVDVPNATLMTIEGAERFGLAQLHQLRGRVSRGQFPGFCCAFADTSNEEAVRRLEAFTQSTDGFALAETDFEIRGPGDLLGTRQHGLPPFRIADLLADGEILAQARDDAQQLAASDPNLERPEHARLRRQMSSRYGQALDLGDVG